MKRIEKILLTTILVFFFAFGYFIGVLAQGFSITITPLSFSADYSYVVGIDGSTFYARNGTTGQIDIENTDAQTVLNYAIDSGGKIFLKAGTYSVEDLTINTESDIIIESDGSAILRLGSNSSNQNVLYIFNSTDIIIRNLIIDGNAGSLSNIGNVEYQQNGIVIRDSNNVLIEENEIRNCRQNAIYLLHNTYDVTIKNNKIHSGNSGILFYNVGFGSTLGSPYRVLVTGNFFWNLSNYESSPQFGIYLSVDTANVTITENFIRGAGTNGIRFDQCSYVNVVSNIILNSGVEGIYVASGGADNVIISNNQVIESTNEGIYINGGDHIIISQNEVYYSGRHGIRVLTDYYTIAQNFITFNNYCGIYIQNAQFGTIFGNTVKNNSRSVTNLYSGIALSNADNTLLEGNVIGSTGENFQKYAIEVTNCDNVKIMGNELYAIKPAVLYYGGTNTNVEVINNIGYITDDEKYENVTEASYIIFSDGSTFYAKNGTTGEIEFSGADSSTVIQSAYNNLDAGKIIVKDESSFSQALSINANKAIEIVFLSGAIVTPQANNLTLIDINTGEITEAAEWVTIRGFHFNAQGYTGITGIKITDGAFFKLYDIRGEYGDVGINLHISAYHVESVDIIGARFEHTKKPIRFTTDKSTTSSFGQTSIRDLYINFPEVGFELNLNCSLYRSRIEGVVMWLSENNSKGFYLDGLLTQTPLDIFLETYGSPTGVIGIDVGANADLSKGRIYSQFLGTFSSRVNNPNDKPIFVIEPYMQDQVDYRLAYTSVSVGVNDAYGSATEIRHPSWRALNMRAVALDLSGSFDVDETITVKITTEYYDGGTSYIEKTYSSTGTYWLSNDDLHNILRTGMLWGLDIQAKTNKASTSVIVKVAGMF